MKNSEFIKQDWVKQEIISRLDYNPETGKLTWKDSDRFGFDRTKAGKEAGHKRVKGVINITP